MVDFIGSQKVPVGDAILRVARGAIDQYHTLMGKAMPASVVSVGKNNTMVTVKIEIASDYTFPQVTCAVAGPEYLRVPIQKDDKGILVPSDYYLGAMDGTGTGVATLSRDPNLSAMVWMPIGNKKFTDVPDADKNKVILYGPDGVVIQTKAQSEPKAKLDVTDEGFKFYIDGTLKFIVDASGARFIGGPRPGGGNYGINVTDHGTQIDNFNFLNHVHQGTQPGSGNSQKINETVSPP